MLKILVVTGAAALLLYLALELLIFNFEVPVLIFKVKQIVAYILQQQEEAYYLEHHYIMDGRTRRAVRSMIEKDYDKGKYRPSKSNVNLNA